MGLHRYDGTAVDMKKWIGFLVGVLGLILTVLATTGIPLPVSERTVQCEGLPV